MVTSWNWIKCLKMLIIPAIDLWEGKVVRLTKGDPSKVTCYSTDPLDTACRWKEEGAKLIHVVDLSAALERGDNLKYIQAIVRESGIDIEVGGGIHSLDKARMLIDAGVKRIIIGTRALEEDFISVLVKEFGEDKICIGVDAKDGSVSVSGWQKNANVSYLDFLGTLQARGIKWVIFTDISRDGTLSGIDTNNLKPLQKFEKLNMILSGGITSMEDITVIKKDFGFFKGVIIGKALYENRISFKEASL